ncbi:MAG: molybdate ABC transporter substrate-binding protein [Pseudomonadota bacterium]
MGQGHAAEAQLRVAVASNFSLAASEIAELFEQSADVEVQLSFASTGKLYAQILHGAPFDVFLSADSDKPLRLESEGRVVANSRFTYATGALVLWSADESYIQDGPAQLRAGEFRRLAMANPRVAPYGLAAEQVLDALEVPAQVASRRVLGENISQAYQFVASGNAELGLVARSQVMIGGRLQRGSAWPVPPLMHTAIKQDAVLLTNGSNEEAGRVFLAFLRSEPALRVLEDHGYVTAQEQLLQPGMVMAP